MQKKKTEIAPAPAETDFYTEALKAFDAPIPAPKKEEPAPETAVEGTKSAAPEKPKRKFNLWWAVALCAILCLVIFMGLGQNKANAPRGEQYIYGIVFEYGEGYIRLITGEKMWYVELEGLEQPAEGLVPNMSTGYQPIWVFYNGEPEDSDQEGYAKKIKATFWKTDSDLFNSQDEIKFDLDGDGEKEIWAASLTRSLPSLHYGDFIYQVVLTAKDAQGNILQECYFDPSASAGIAFSDRDGKLALVQYNSGSYTELELRMKEGKLAIYRAGKALPLYDFVQPPQTDPLVTEPTPPPGLETSIRFYIPAGKSSVTKTLSPGDARVLQDQLDALNWTEADDVERNIQWIFYFVDDESQRVYNFCNGILKCGGKEAKIGTELTQKLMDLMGRTMPEQQAYQAYLSDGEMLQITFYDDGLARLKQLDKNGNALRTYLGRFSNISNMYVLHLGEQPRHTLVLEKKEGRLDYLAYHSEQTIFVEQNHQLSFYDPNAGGSLEVSLRRSDGSWDSGSSPAVLPVQTLSALRQKLSNCEWKAGEINNSREIIARFTVSDGVGENIQNGAQYWLLTGGRLLAETPPGGEDMIATIDPILWHLLAGLSNPNGAKVNTVYNGTIADGVQISLELKDNGLFQLDSQLQGQTDAAYTITGYYTYLGEVIMLMGLDQELTCICLDVLDRELVYNADYSTPNQALGMNKELTLTSRDTTQYKTPIMVKFDFVDPEGNGNFSYRDDLVTLSDEQAAAAVQLLQSLQWEAPEDGAEEGMEVPHIGWLRFLALETWAGPFDVCIGMRLVYGDSYVAQLTQSQWNIACDIMTSAGEAMYQPLSTVVDGTVYSLLLSENKGFWLAKEGELQAEHISGTYCVLQNEVIVCYGSDGQMFALRRSAEGWRLLTRYNFIETFNIPGETIFANPVVDILTEEN